MNKEQQKHTGKNNGLPIRAYALRYLKYNSSPVPSLLAEAPATPDRISDSGIMDISWDEHLTEVWLNFTLLLAFKLSDFLLICCMCLLLHAQL